MEIEKMNIETVTLPTELTDDNLAEYIRIKDFSETINVPCFVCSCDKLPEFDCIYCGESGEITMKVPVTLETIRSIYDWIVYTEGENYEVPEQKIKKVYVVRKSAGLDFITFAICELEATARRLLPKYPDATIKKADLVKFHGRWYAPPNAYEVITPSMADIEKQGLIDENRLALKKAKALGLTDEEIKALSKYPE